MLLGEFRCPPEFPGFRDAGRIRNHVVAFPRSAVWIERDGERPFVSDSTQAVLHTPGREYSRGAVSSAGDVTDWIALPEHVAREIVGEHSVTDAGAARAFRHGRASVPGSLYRAQRALFARAASGEAEAMELEETALRLVGETLALTYRATATPADVGARSEDGTRSADGSTGKARQRDLAEAAKAVLAKHLEQNQGIAQLAERLDVSSFHLCRTFRRATGTTVHGYRRALRLREALHRLAEYRGDLSSLALDLGFSSHAHLTSAFRGAFGVPPSQVALR
ncbi:MAG: helix-turn-helix transcriptional regulator [Gemmatimonadaceae bacterium]|nr:helix-turn-helix transcriptional regulator [Gemmatimonadaceae bacterium]